MSFISIGQNERWSQNLQTPSCWLQSEYRILQYIF